MSKRSRAVDSRLEAINSAFETLFAITDTSKAADGVTVGVLKHLKHQALSAATEKEELIHKAAREFTLEEAVQDFGLIYSSEMDETAKHWWIIEVLPEVKAFQPSAGLVSLLRNYSGIYDRSSEAACRIAVDFLLCECIAVLRGKVSGISPTQPTEDGRRTPTPWDTVKVHCEVSFSHSINPVPIISKKTIVGGRVDHGVGIMMRSRKAANRRFHSLLLCVEAKVEGSILSALAQLVVYLACLRQSRVNRGRSDTSVYGVATDGLLYIFLTITHEGVLKQSKQFDIMRGDLPTVLGCLKYILEIAIFMTPTSTPEKGMLMTSDELEADADDPIDLDDTPYLQHDEEE
ncbi:hypothetical protein BYT27DRAFT_7188627 [Phlegmacium glaucopus]|nr:hypothetical protein BYT27DRAFT_7188627 [Phlegmacium glaucopus]